MTESQKKLRFRILCAVGLLAWVALAHRTYLIARLCGSGANLARANLVGRDLRGADLSGANLQEAHLAGADLRATNLASTNLRRADLRGAVAGRADLSGAVLKGADLRGASLRDADVRGADLHQAVMTCCSDPMRTVDLQGARYDAATQWPGDFNPEAWGALRIPAPTAARR